MQILLIQRLIRDDGQAAFFHLRELGVHDFIILLYDGIQIFPCKFGDKFSA